MRRNRLIDIVAVGVFSLYALTGLGIAAAAPQSSSTDAFRGWTYKGAIKRPSGLSVPIMVRIWLDRESSGSRWHGTFTLGNEAGPYPIESVIYDSATESVTLTYNAERKRPVWWTTLKGHPGVPLQGSITSLYGDVGRLELTPTNNEDYSASRPYIQGTWSGECIKDSDSSKHHGRLVLINYDPPADLVYDPPADQTLASEYLPWAPLKPGSFWLDDKPSYAVQRKGCAPNYLSATIDCIVSSTEGCKVSDRLLGILDCPPDKHQENASLHGEFSYANRDFAIEIHGLNDKISCRKLTFDKGSDPPL